MMGGGYCATKATYIVAGAGSACGKHLVEMIDFARDFQADENPYAAEDRLTVLVRRLPCAPFERGDVAAALAAMNEGSK